MTRLWRAVPLVALGGLVVAGCEGDGSGIRFQGTNEIPAYTGPGAGNDDDEGGGGVINAALTGMCDRVQYDGTCREYLGSAWIKDDAVADCNTGTYYEDQLCDDGETRIGLCATDPSGLLTVNIYYYEGAYYTEDDMEEEEQRCQIQGGNFFLF